eukprot:340202_1
MDAETGFVATNFSEETHSNGKVALRLSTDSEGKNEAGFAYYPSGRVAGCVSKAVTYGILGSLSYFYEDDKDRTLLAFFDHEANGFALSNLGSHQCLKKGCECQNYNHAPAARFLCKHCNHELTSHQQGRKFIAGSQGVRVFSENGILGKSFSDSPPSAVEFELNESLMLTYTARDNISVRFNCESITKVFEVGKAPQRSDTYMDTLEKNKFGKFTATLNST